MKKHFMAVSCLALLSAFDNGSPGWKLDADGKIAMKDGNPIYLDAAGGEATVGGDTIASLRREAKTHREAKEAAEAKLLVFKDIDPEKARDAVDKLSKIDAKKLIDSGEVDKLTNQIKEQFATQLAEKDAALTTSNSRIDNMLIEGLFNGSDFVRNNIAVPPDMFQDSFRKNFKVEEGKIVAYGKDGNRLLSKTKHGEYAEPDEALQLLVEAHPQKDVIMKANTGTGTGNNGNGGQRAPGVKVMKRSEFDKLSGQEKAAIVPKITSKEISLTD